MNKRYIKDKLHKFFFPERAQWLSESWKLNAQRQQENLDLEGRLAEELKAKYLIEKDMKKLEMKHDDLLKTAQSLAESNDVFKKTIKILEDRLAKKPAMADLMRETLGLRPIQFSNADRSGFIPHYIDEAKEDVREKIIIQLAQMWQMDAFHLMINFHIDDQANYSFRSADEKQLMMARSSVNGISLIRNDVRKCYEDFIEKYKKPEEFNQFEVIGNGST